MRIIILFLLSGLAAAVVFPDNEFNTFVNIFMAEMEGLMQNEVTRNKTEQLLTKMLVSVFAGEADSIQLTSDEQATLEALREIVANSLDMDTALLDKALQEVMSGATSAATLEQEMEDLAKNVTVSNQTVSNISGSFNVVNSSVNIVNGTIKLTTMSLTMEGNITVKDVTTEIFNGTNSERPVLLYNNVTFFFPNGSSKSVVESIVKFPNGTTLEAKLTTVNGTVVSNVTNINGTGASVSWNETVFNVTSINGTGASVSRNETVQSIVEAAANETSQDIMEQIEAANATLTSLVATLQNLTSGVNMSAINSAELLAISEQIQAALMAAALSGGSMNATELQAVVDSATALNTAIASAEVSGASAAVVDAAEAAATAAASALQQADNTLLSGMNAGLSYVRGGAFRSAAAGILLLCAIILYV